MAVFVFPGYWDGGKEVFGGIRSEIYILSGRTGRVVFLIIFRYNVCVIYHM